MNGNLEEVEIKLKTGGTFDSETGTLTFDGIIVGGLEVYSKKDDAFLMYVKFDNPISLADLKIQSINLWNLMNHIDADKAIKVLDTLKEKNPNQTITVETPDGMSSCKLGDALIYEGMSGEIIIDSE